MSCDIPYFEKFSIGRLCTVNVQDSQIPTTHARRVGVSSKNSISPVTGEMENEI